MTPHRRFHTFNDHLRSRFNEKLQRVTLTGGLVCPHPDGQENCPFCTEAIRLNPDYLHGYPVHEQIRRGANFSKRRGETEHRIMASIPATPLPPPVDHLKATLEAAAKDNVAVIAVAAKPDGLTDDVTKLLAEFATPEREVWLDLEAMPDDWPAARDERLKFGVMIELARDGAAAAGDHPGALSVEKAAERVIALKPDAVGLVAPAIVDGSPEALAWQRGEIEEEDLDTFAERAARFLELIPAGVAVHPIVFAQRSDAILGPDLLTNRQKVQEAVGRALEERGTTQGAVCLDGTEG